MDSEHVLRLTLYVAGWTPDSERAIANLRLCCDRQLAGRYQVEVVDVSEQPQAAQDERILVQVLATPTMLGVLPPALRRIIVDDLIMGEQVLLGLNLQPAEEALQPTGGVA